MIYSGLDNEIVRTYANCTYTIIKTAAAEFIANWRHQELQMLDAVLALLGKY